MKIFILIFIACTIVVAQTSIEVSANHFMADQQSGKSVISGNVVIKRNKDELKSNEVIFYIDDKKSPIKYEANGDVNFKVTLNDGRIIEGNAQQAIYMVETDIYELIGNVFLKEMGKNNQIRGNRISLSRKKGFVNVEGGNNKPAKVIFFIQDK